MTLTIHMMLTFFPGHTQLQTSYTTPANHNMFNFLELHQDGCIHRPRGRVTGDAPTTRGAAG